MWTKLGVLSIGLNKFFTKNLVISTLIGISIIGGAFWSRINKVKDSSAIERGTEASTLTYQKEAEQTGEAKAHNETTEGIVPSASTVSYDELSDKNALYLNGTAKYAEKSLALITANRATLTSYGTTLAKILNGYPFYTGLTPTEITYNIYSGKNKDTGLIELESIRLSYEAVSKRLLSESTPRGLEAMQIELANSADRIAQLIGNMERISDEQLLALNSARQYVDEAKYFIQKLAEISYYLKDKNIVIGEKDRLKLAVDVIN